MEKRVLTTSHGFMAYLANKYLNRKLKIEIHPFYMVAGATFPDIFNILNKIMEYLAANLFSAQFYSQNLAALSKLFHSLPLAAICFLLFCLTVLLIKRFTCYGERGISFLFGWEFFHVFIDLLTHKSGGWPYLLPWNLPINGILDHRTNYWVIALEIAVLGYILWKLVLYLYRKLKNSA